MEEEESQEKADSDDESITFVSDYSESDVNDDNDESEVDDHDSDDSDYLDDSDNECLSYWDKSYDSEEDDDYITEHEDDPRNDLSIGRGAAQIYERNRMNRRMKMRNRMLWWISTTYIS